ncbi:hypothetical protein Tco_0693514 [Tanacetum coccineum]|uniref:Uncharacterized protein n=1 Tax=Tanacetum coccineum TaxID=301880 RepID=A0ABQ4YIR1_9ASTR
MLVLMKRWPESFSRGFGKRKGEEQVEERSYYSCIQPMEYDFIRQDSMQIRFVQRSFKRERDREKKFTMKSELSCFMYHCCIRGDFLLKQSLALIKDLNKKVAGIKNADTIKEENKEEEETLSFEKESFMVQMLKLKLESEEDNSMALELIRFVKKLIAEFG